MTRRILLAMAAASVMLIACSLFRSPADNAPVYIVFFRYDSAALTPDARLIVDQAAKAVRDTEPGTVELAGYTQATALPAGRRLAQSRFDTVAQTLVADGVDPKLLARVPLADAESVLTATADRRVEIRLVNKARP